MSPEKRSLPTWLLPVGLVALVIALVSIALLRGPMELDPDTPEGTVQEYLRAISEERWDDAVDIVQEDWRGACQGVDLEPFAPGDFSAELGSDGSSGRVDFEPVPPEGAGTSTSLPNGDTQVEVTIHHNAQGEIGAGWDEPAVFQLLEADDFWWLTNDPWPYFVWSCREA